MSTIGHQWRWEPLGGVAQVVTGRTPSPAVKEYWGGNLPFVTPGDLIQGLFEGPAARSLSDAGRQMVRLVPPGSTLVTCIGSSVGKVALTSVECTTNQQINSVTARPGVDSLFLHYAIEFSSDRIRRLAGNTAVPLVTKHQLAHFRILTPPLALQERLGSVLWSCDSTAAAIAALIERTRAFKRSLMNDLLTGRRRFPEYAHQPWARARLGALFTERDETDVCDLPLLAVTADRGIIPRAEVGRKDTSNEDKSKYKRVVPGDIAYNTMRMWQGVSALSHLEGIVSPAYTVVTPQEQMLGAYARHFFKLPRQVHQFLRRSQGLVDDTLNLKYPSFARIEVTFPSSLHEQSAIAALLARVEQEVELLSRLLLELGTLKRGLMQRLLSGGIEIPAHLAAAAATTEETSDDS